MLTSRHDDRRRSLTLNTTVKLTAQGRQIHSHISSFRFGQPGIELRQTKRAIEKVAGGTLSQPPHDNREHKTEHTSNKNKTNTNLHYASIILQTVCKASTAARISIKILLLVPTRYVAPWARIRVNFLAPKWPTARTTHPVALSCLLQPPSVQTRRSKTFKTEAIPLIWTRAFR